MKLAVSTSWVQNTETAVDMMSRAAELGFSAFELGVYPRAKDIPEILAACHANNWQLVSLHNPVVNAHLPKEWMRGDAIASIDEDLRRQGIEDLLRTIDIAEEAGASVVVLHAGRVELPTESRKRNDQFRRAVADGDRERHARMLKERLDKALPNLDALAHSLERVLEQPSPVRIALESRYHYDEIPVIDELGWIFRRFDTDRLAYWHDVGHCEVLSRLGVDPHAEWLERFAKKNRRFPPARHHRPERPPARGQRRYGFPRHRRIRGQGRHPRDRAGVRLDRRPTSRKRPRPGRPGFRRVSLKQAQKGELALIRAIRKRLAGGPRPPFGPGDDCALVRVGADRLAALTTDMLLDGAHFDTRTMTPRQIGRKALAVSLSDVAAMGMQPAVVVVGVALPNDTSMATARALVDGMAKLAEAFDVHIVGGDVTSWSGALAICTTVLGRSGRGKPVLRSGAKPGHDVYVTGPLGGSILRKHWAFTPRVAEGLALAKTFGVSSMIDVSDGLSTDLNHIAEESGVGAIVEATAVPVSAAARRLAKTTGRTPLDHALNDGEDFELLFTAPRSRRAQLLAARGLPVTPVRIGTVDRAPGVRLRDTQGKLHPLEPKGYEHFK